VPDLGELAYGIGGVDTFSKLGVPAVPGDGADLPSPPDACMNITHLKRIHIGDCYSQFSNKIMV
jgi:hypothetical protein